MDVFLLEAMREVDAMLPGTPPITPPPLSPVARRRDTKPLGSFYSYMVDGYVRQDGWWMSREDWIYNGFAATWKRPRP